MEETGATNDEVDSAPSDEPRIISIIIQSEIVSYVMSTRTEEAINTLIIPSTSVRCGVTRFYYSVSD